MDLDMAEVGGHLSTSWRVTAERLLAMYEKCPLALGCVNGIAAIFI
jgi:hypothetical protein